MSACYTIEKMALASPFFFFLSSVMTHQHVEEQPTLLLCDGNLNIRAELTKTGLENVWVLSSTLSL